MKRFFLTIFALLCFFLPASSYAQDKVLMRSGAREAYSRVVFEWKGDVSYTLDESSSGKVVITFARAGELDQSKIDLGELKNITGIKILSSDPVKVSFDIPEKSKVRAFKAAGKVFLDVYNSPDRKVVKQVKSEVVPKAPEKVADKKQEKNVEKKTLATPPAYVLVPEILRPEVEKKKLAETVEQKRQAVLDPKVLQERVKQEEHIISLTSTSSVDMAIFENANELWLVLDRDDSQLFPATKSAIPNFFSSFERMSLGRSEKGIVAQAFRTPAPKGLKAKSQGGGLVWRLIFSKDIVPAQPIEPVRKVVSSGQNRNGKILWSLTRAEDIIETTDPFTGQKLIIVTVSNAEQNTGEARSFVDFDVLKSYSGLAIRPKVDDLEVKKTELGIEISRNGGLAIMHEGKLASAVLDQKKPFIDLSTQSPQESDHSAVPKSQIASPRVFNFVDWQTGNIDILNENKNVILSEIKDKEESKQVEDLMKLAKMHLAHGRGAETLGFLRFAEQEVPQLAENPEFLALRGVARAFTWKSEIALADLLHKDLGRFDEIKYWKSFVLADLGDWAQAAEILPDDYSPLSDYPSFISHRLALVLAEVNLRAGKREQAEKLLDLVEHNKEHLEDSMVAALKYLRGEALRQKGEKEKTIELWQSLEGDKDDLYRTKARLALAVLLEEMGKINNQQAIDRLEHLRYAWRGDQLEAQINYWLGRYYFKKKDFVKGLNIMRDAAAIAVDTQLGAKIAADMGNIFSELFLGDNLKDVSALDAVTLYEQFSELTPPAEKGDKLIQKLAERLVQADLLGRAANLLKQQVDHRLEGEEKLRVAVRLAAIQLLDKKPDMALESLSKGEAVLSTMPETPSKAARVREIELLKAKAYSQNGQAVRALSILEALPLSKDVSRLKADIAWQEGYWEDAAAALDDVITTEDISSTRPMSDKQVDLIMNRVIALSLSNDRIAIANMREKYSDLMRQSKKAHQFEVITRLRQNSELADRETLMSVMSEVDLFQDFLESYRQGN